jgi:RNA polymerase sigma-70 factor (ECF subfamily)
VDDNLERYLSTDTLRFIRIKANRLAGRYGFLPDEVEDLQQSLLLDCMRRMGQFNPQRGNPRSFARSIVNHSVATLIELKRAQRRGYNFHHRSLNSPADSADPDSPDLAETISEDEHHDRLGWGSQQFEQKLQIRLDLTKAIVALPADLRLICRLLMAMDHVAQVAAALGISRATLHRRMRIIRAAFAQSGLAEGRHGAIRSIAA